MHIFVQLTSKLALSRKQPSVECVPGVLSQTQSWQSVSVTTQSHLVQRLRRVMLYQHSPIFASNACTGTTLSLRTLLLCHQQVR
jgi:hypothetical protein